MVEQNRIAKMRRPYRLRARADSMDRTRARITEAAIELHGSIGPAATTMSAVAERAGVTRATLYRHFPNEQALFTACSAEWRRGNPAPNPDQWRDISDPYDRLRTALPLLYSWYRSSEMMRANLLRDLATLPSPIRHGIESYPRAVGDVLDVGLPGGQALDPPGIDVVPDHFVSDFRRSDGQRQPDVSLSHHDDAHQ